MGLVDSLGPMKYRRHCPIGARFIELRVHLQDVANIATGTINQDLLDCAMHNGVVDSVLALSRHEVTQMSVIMPGHAGDTSGCFV